MTRYAKKTDGNQVEIVNALRKHGVQVVITNFGESFPDLLCGYGRSWSLLEVKQPDGDLSRGQLEWLSNAKGRVAVVTTPDEAVDAAINGIHSKHTLFLNSGFQLEQWLIKNPNQQSLRVSRFRRIINGKKI